MFLTAKDTDRLTAAATEAIESVMAQVADVDRAHDGVSGVSVSFMQDRDGAVRAVATATVKLRRCSLPH